MGENDQDPLKMDKNTSNHSDMNIIDTEKRREIKAKHIHIATINCRSLRTSEKLKEFELAVKEIKWDIIGISEMRRFGEGIQDRGNYILHYIGETPGLYGVGFMVRKNLADNIEELRGISERIAILNIKLSIKGKNEEWSIIQAYSPTESDKKEDVIKIENFYNDLQSTMESAHKNKIVMGDFNGQIGTQKNGEEYIIGRYGFGFRSKNGTRLVNFATENKLSILNSFYKKKPQKKWTWISPSGLYKNEIDYILSNNQKPFQNITIISNLNFNTDHRMVRVTLTGRRPKKLRKFHNKCTTIEYTGNTDLLLENLQTSLKKDRHGKKELTSTEEKYNGLINQLKTVTRKTNTNNKKEISLITKHLLQERKELIQQKKSKEIRQKITEISKKISEQLRKERKTKRLSTIEKFIERTGGIKKARKELNHKKEWIPRMKKKDGITTGNRLDILKIATDYYRHLYTSQRFEETQKEYNIPTDAEQTPKILTIETMQAIKTQKLDKAPGADLITNELLKTTLPVIAPKLTDIFNEILNTENIPDDWTKSTIILLHKKGDKGDIGNYRPISLMSNIYKVFSKIILSRITNTLEENQPKEQAGFRRHFSTIDHIHALRQILQKFKEYNKTYYLGFIDFNKAFDTLEHSFIWNALEAQGVETKYIRILKNIYTKSTARVKLESTGDEFPIKRGVRQGDPISPKLFSAVLEMIFRNLKWTKGLNINGENLSHLRFADDIILFSDCPKTLESMLQQLSNESIKAGLSMNLTKTKIMSNSTNIEIKIKDEVIEYVQEYIYLGQLISQEDCMQKEIERRIANTWKRFWSLSEVMKNKDMPIKQKRKVFNMCILPCLLYGCQTWALTEELSNKLKICQNGIERSTIGVKRKDRIKLKDIKSKTNFKNAYTTYKQLKWRWSGHMIREKKEKWTSLITEWYPRDGKRSRGRQTKRWEDDIIKIAGTTWTRTAKDRTQWKSLEEAFVEGQAAIPQPPFADI